MKSTMTEKQFGERLAGLLAARKWGEGLLKCAKRIVLEAGLEFAPEPVRLPERIDLYFVRSDTPFGDITALYTLALLIPEGAEIITSIEQRDAMYAAARARYNAYPGLREKAERLCRRVTESNSLFATDDFAALEAELAKGPKL